MKKKHLKQAIRDLNKQLDYAEERRVYWQHQGGLQYLRAEELLQALRMVEAGSAVAYMREVAKTAIVKGEKVL